MRKRVILVIILTLTGLAGAVLASPAAAVVLGVGDNSPAMFADPRFTALGIKEARIVVPWDAATRGADRSILEEFGVWLAQARADGVTPLVSFNADSGQAGNFIPSVGVYVRAVKAFIRRFPTVRRYTAWNEPDWPYRSLARDPALAAAYFNVLVDVCPGCTVLAGDVFLPTHGAPQTNGALSTLAPWLKQYLRFIHHRPREWALHDYYDSRGHDASQLLTVLGLTRGHVWLDETGGVESRGHWAYPAQGALAAASDDAYLLGLARRYHRVTRVYHYEWQARQHSFWDSGLISANGSVRPAYKVLLKWLRGRPGGG